MYLWLFVPFFLQAILMALDECIFHQKREMPLWEKIGHPLDTLSVLAIYLFIFSTPLSASSLTWFISLSVFSCLLITKDEFVHKHHCSGSEHWLHAVLFVLHPLLLASLGIFWPILHDMPTLSWFQASMPNKFLIGSFLRIQCFLTLIFFLYQIIYWNFLCKKKKV